MSNIITPDNPNPTLNPIDKKPTPVPIRWDHLLAVVVNKLGAEEGITIDPHDLDDFIKGDKVLMNAIQPEGILLKVMTKEEVRAFIQEKEGNA